MPIRADQAAIRAIPGQNERGLIHLLALPASSFLLLFFLLYLLPILYIYLDKETNVYVSQRGLKQYVSTLNTIFFMLSICFNFFGTRSKARANC